MERLNINEMEIKKQIKTYLKKTGWFYFHNLQRRYSFKGIPDITIIKNGIVIMIEVKTPENKKGLSTDQEKFRQSWQDHGGIFAMIRSVDELNNFIKNLKKEG